MHLPHLLALHSFRWFVCFGCARNSVNGCTNVFGVFRALAVCRWIAFVLIFSIFSCFHWPRHSFFWHKMLLKSPSRKYLERMKCFMRTNFSSLGVFVLVCIFRSRELVVLFVRHTSSSLSHNTNKCAITQLVRASLQLKRCSMCETFCLFAVTKNYWQSLYKNGRRKKTKTKMKNGMHFYAVQCVCVCFSVSLIISAVFVIVIAIERSCLFCCHLSHSFFVRSFVVVSMVRLQAFRLLLLCAGWCCWCCYFCTLFQFPSFRLVCCWTWTHTVRLEFVSVCKLVCARCVYFSVSRIWRRYESSDRPKRKWVSIVSLYPHHQHHLPPSIPSNRSSIILARSNSIFDGICDGGARLFSSAQYCVLQCDILCTLPANRMHCASNVANTQHTERQNRQIKQNETAIERMRECEREKNRNDTKNLKWSGE